MSKQRIIFFTGAGISAQSGIPTFDEVPGLRDKLTRDFALTRTTEYMQTIKKMKEMCDEAEPNAAHYAIATLGCPVITMNIDGLHQRAGSNNIIAVHGRLPHDEEFEQDNFKFLLNIPVLYGDPAPRYDDAINLVKSLEYNNSIFVVVGTSFYTGISEHLLKKAKQRKAEIIIINDDACERVPKLMPYLRSKLQSWEKVDNEKE
jgi:NAD-dependent deacetylase